jgi:hypothetical protein
LAITIASGISARIARISSGRDTKLAPIMSTPASAARARLRLSCSVGIS